MSQNLDVALEPLAYTRIDFTALRAYLLRIPTPEIAALYYSPEAPQVLYGLDQFLKEMRNELVERSVITHPHFYRAMSKAGFGGKFLEDALKQIRLLSDTKAGKPRLDDLLAKWIRPKTAGLLLTQNVKTLGDLVDTINARGYSWWKPIPKLGEGKAKAVLDWLKNQGFPISNEVQTPSAMAKVSFFNEISPQNRVLAPLEAITLPSAYDGSVGENRAPAKPYIDAGNDLEAVQAYLLMHRNNPKTFRSYTKELERFLLWAVIVRGKPLSSLLVNDCEAYKDFLQAPSPEFCGKVMPRFSKAWKPFTPAPLSPKSQKYSVVVIKSCFDWLVKVRYLAGNPWSAVRLPEVEKDEHLMQIEKALPSDVWDKLTALLDQESKPKGASQMRLARAAILLMGDSGLRREEVAGAQREDFIPSAFAKVYELRVLGKRKKWRTVPVSPRAAEALKAHFKDRNEVWNDGEFKSGPLLSPLKLPPTKRTKNKHSDNQKGPRKGYSANGIYIVVDQALDVLLQLESYWDEEEKIVISGLSAHDFRHTFATLGVARGIPIDVMQSVLGHASMSTTSIYVQSRKQRTMEEAAKYFAGKPAI